MAPQGSAFVLEPVQGATHEEHHDRISVLAAIIAAPLTAQQIRERTDLPWERVKSAIAYLKRHDIARSMGGGHCHAYQRECAVCSHSAGTMKGHAVYVDPETFRWFCEECWDAEVERVKALVGEDG